MALLQWSFEGIRPVLCGSVFRLHSCATTFVFFLCATITFVVYLVVDPAIECIVGGDSQRITREYVHSYCWGAAVTGSEKSEGGTFHHTYYQWIPFFLVTHGILFYVPGYIWNLLENGRISSILSCNTKVHSLTKYLLESRTGHATYAASYVACQLLNFANAIGNFFWINLYLAGTFVSFGRRLMYHVDTPVFSGRVNCNVERYNRVGQLEEHSLLCHMRISSFCQKMYAFLYCWLVVLLVLTAFNLVWYAALSASRSLRKCVLMHRSGLSHKVLNYEQLMHQLRVSDFFVLYLLGNNVDTISFQEVLISLSSQSISSANEHEMSPLAKSD